MARCVSCGANAGPEEWRKWCKRCYALNKREEEDQLRQQLAYYRSECERLHTELMFAEGIPADKLKLLIQLCHPDKHNGSKASNSITQWLLERRAK